MANPGRGGENDRHCAAFEPGLAHNRMRGGIKGRRKSKKDRLRGQAARFGFNASGYDGARTQPFEVCCHRREATAHLFYGKDQDVFHFLHYNIIYTHTSKVDPPQTLTTHTQQIKYTKLKEKENENGHQSTKTTINNTVLHTLPIEKEKGKGKKEKGKKEWIGQRWSLCRGTSLAN